MDYIEKTVKENVVFKGKIMTVHCDDALLPNGVPCQREIVKHSGGACVLYEDEGEILFVRQYRYAYGESVYELPAGKLEKGEDPALSAARELEEEAGIKAGRLQLLFVMYPSPGYTDEKIYIYRAFDGKKAKAHLDEGEFLDVEYIPVEKVKEMLQKGEIRAGKTIVALQAYFLSEK